MTSAREMIARYKTEYHRKPEAFELRTQAPGGEVIRLRPLQAAADHIAWSDVLLLTEWRNRFRQFFLTDFTATPERTLRWLTSVAGPDPSRILFMIEPLSGGPIGHVGLCNVDDKSGELDNVVRGRDEVRGAMKAATAAVCTWARSTLGLTQLRVRVMRDNPAVRFYEQLGFRPLHDLPLEYHGDSTEGSWIEAHDQAGVATRYLRCMEQAA